MSLPTIANDATIRVSRFESLYPRDNPSSYVVGFSVTCKKNSKSTYADICIAYKEAEGMEEEQVVHLAWSRLESTFQTWLETIYEKSPVVGSIFVPPSAVKDPEPEPVQPTPELAPTAPDAPNPIGASQSEPTTTEEPAGATTEEPTATTTEEPTA